MATKKIEEIKMKTKTTRNQEENQLKDLRDEQATLEWIYECPLKLLSEAEKSQLIEYASNILGRDGEVEVNRLILENRLPIIVGRKGNWYTQWYSDECTAPVVMLLLETWHHYCLLKDREGFSCPEYGLRECLSLMVGIVRRRLIPLALQLMNEGEYSAVIERQIECLERLNTGLPFSPEEFSKIVN